MNLPDPPLLLITDRRAAKRPILQVVEAALIGGCHWVSLREKDLDFAARLSLLRDLVALGRRHGARITVHGDIAAAIETGADGVHLPAGGAPHEARARLGPHALIGVSAHARADIEAAQRARADYVTLSPIFSTASKPGYGPVLGPAGLALAARDLSIPIVALGGIAAPTIPVCRAAGAAGVAVMGAIMRDPEPSTATAAMIAALKRPARS